MDVWGLREELYDIARKVAVVGYYVLLPDLYYRQGRVRHQWHDADGRMSSPLNRMPLPDENRMGKRTGSPIPAMLSRQERAPVSAPDTFRPSPGATPPVLSAR